MRISSILLTSLFLSGVVALPQQTGPGAGPSPGAPGAQPMPTSPSMPGATNPTSPGRNPFPGQDPNQRSPFPDQMQRPIFISGKVIMEDGQPPPDSVTIERVCNGVVRPEGYTDSKGRFNVELGRNNAIFADASNSGGLDDGIFGRPGQSSRNPGLGGMGGSRVLTERDLFGCEIRATLAGFRADPVNLAGRRSLDNPDIGSIILRRLSGVEGYTFSMTTAMAPKEAKRSFEKGVELMRKKKIDEAAVELEKATSLYPKYAIAWYDLGRTYEQQKKQDAAIKAFESAIAADPKYVKPYVNLALGLAQKKEWEKTAEISSKAIRLNPIEYPQLFFFNAVANLNMGKLDEAEKSARDGSKSDPKGRMPRLDQLLGVILVQKNDLNGAKESFTNFLKKDPDSPEAQQVRLELARLNAPVAPVAPSPKAAPKPAQPEAEPAPASPTAEPAAAVVAPAPAPAPAPTGRAAWPSWSSGISDLPPGTLSKELDAATIGNEIAKSVYSVVTAAESSLLRPDAKQYHGAAVAVSDSLLVTHCDTVEKGPVAAIYQNGKLVSQAVRLSKSRRSAGLCVLEISGARVRPVNGVRYAQDLTAGEKTFTIAAGGLGEGTLTSAKTQGGLKLLIATSPVTPETAGGGLFDIYGNLIGVTTARSANTSIAVEEFYQ